MHKTHASLCLHRRSKSFNLKTRNYKLKMWKNRECLTLSKTSKSSIWEEILQTWTALISWKVNITVKILIKLLTVKQSASLALSLQERNHVNKTRFYLQLKSNKKMKTNSINNLLRNLKNSRQRFRSSLLVRDMGLQLAACPNNLTIKTTSFLLRF